jgi:signal peptidase
MTRIPTRPMALRRIATAGSRALLVGAVALLGVIGLGPRLGFYRTVTVLSGSMQPTFAPGDVLIVTREPLRDVHVGDVITYAIPLADHHVESHRVIRIVRKGDHPIVVTKGDANSAADPWRAELQGDSVWQMRGKIPWLGRLILVLRAPLVHEVTLFLSPLLFAFTALRKIWRPGRRRQEVADGTLA